MTLSNHRQLFAAISGNFIEWYDFALYIFLAPVLAKQFFPDDAPGLAILFTFTLHAVSFFFRPLGAIIFGYLGDVYGRCIALKLSLSCLTLFSIIISLLPTFHQIGYIATLLLCVCRIVQGICLGGEFAGSMIYLSETAATSERAFMSSMSNNGSNLGIMLASGSAAILSSLMSDVTFIQYGYRILFFMGGMIGVIGFTFRSDLRESPEFLSKKVTLMSPLKGHVNIIYQNYFSYFLSLLLVPWEAMR